MTYNATLSTLQQAVAAGLLQDVIFPGMPARRRLFVSPDVHRILDNNSSSAFNLYELKKVLKFYLAGHLVTVCLDGRKKARSDFKRMQNLTEIWVLSSRRPKTDQYRLMGRFLARDIFVGLAIMPRSELGDRNNYHLQASKLIDQWNAIFPHQEPLLGTEAADYFSGVYNDVDKF